ncbi:MAG: hypothetical protein J6V08_02860 [Candidatus Methanomethylophilaceae archaeon]|nr:hypothetical protein [Candidatus Methanomethylophilaceae archaeon]
MIGFETIFSALVVVTLLLVLLSVPSALITLIHSSGQYKKYTLMRARRGDDPTSIPKKHLVEWNAVRTDVGYITVLTQELEKLSALRPALFNSEVSAILIVVLMIVPGFEKGVFILMAILLALCLFVLVYGYRIMKRFGEAYVVTARNMSDKGEDSNDSMYV